MFGQAPVFISALDDTTYEAEAARKLFDEVFEGCAGVSSWDREPQPERSFDTTLDVRKSGNRRGMHKYPAEDYARDWEPMTVLDNRMTFSKQHMAHSEGRAGLALFEQQHQEATESKRHFPEHFTESDPTAGPRPRGRRRCPATVLLRRSEGVDEVVFGGTAASAEPEAEAQRPAKSSRRPRPEPPPAPWEPLPQKRRSILPTEDGGPLPTLFLSHGSGAMPLMWDAAHPVAKFFASLVPSGIIVPDTLRAILIVSPHWETQHVEVTYTRELNHLHYDYIGFPEEFHDIMFNPPGAPDVSRRVVELLHDVNIPASMNHARRLDSAVFVPLMLMGTAVEEVPVVEMSIPQISLQKDAWRENARKAMEIGRALAPLRSEGVLIIGSGQSVNNMCNDHVRAEQFVEAMKRTCTEPHLDARNNELQNWRQTWPHGRDIHKHEGRLLPLHVVAAAAEDEPGQVIGDFWSGPVASTHIRFGGGGRGGITARRTGRHYGGPGRGGVAWDDEAVSPGPSSRLAGQRFEDSSFSPAPSYRGLERMPSVGRRYNDRGQAA